ncbi:MAG: YgjV family protein [Treponema sp.]|nr:YgjV family protein [Treponema sp.]
METRILLEIIGYIGSALVVISMMMTSVLRLRVVNILGSAIALCYAIAVKAYPVAALNAFLIAVNVVKTVQLFRVEKSYHLIQSKGTAGLPQYLVQKYNKDILNFFPDFKKIDDDDDVFILMNGDAATGITAGKIDKNKIFNVKIDYTTPAYRDNSAGLYLYKEIGKRGCKRVVFETSARNHEAYMYKIGFVKISRGKYVKELIENL